jgi:hypothetical protein
MNVVLDEKNSLAVLEPQEALSREDFEYAKSVIDPFIQNNEKLKAIIIHVKDFPWWDSFSGLISHFEFIHEHHKKVSYVVFVTDSTLIDVVEPISKHFVSAKVKTFSYDELEDAKEWIKSN